MITLFLKEPPYCSPQWLHQFISPPTVKEGSLFSTRSAFIVCGLFNDVCLCMLWGKHILCGHLEVVSYFPWLCIYSLNSVSQEESINLFFSEKNMKDSWGQTEQVFSMPWERACASAMCTLVPSDGVGEKGWLSPCSLLPLCSLALGSSFPRGDQKKLEMIWRKDCCHLQHPCLDQSSMYFPIITFPRTTLYPL